VRYEDDFGSFWMVDDNEFVKRRHLSRGRPRKYDPSPSPTGERSGNQTKERSSAGNQRENSNSSSNKPDEATSNTPTPLSQFSNGAQDAISGGGAQ
jgi:hypothetical protein